MTQHHYKTECKGEAVRVVAGWDRTCRGFFMHIEHDDSEDEEPIYCNIYDGAGFPKSFDPFVDRLEQYDIELPKQMVLAIVDDKACNRGNAVTHWRPDGTRARKQ